MQKASSAMNSVADSIGQELSNILGSDNLYIELAGTGMRMPAQTNANMMKFEKANLDQFK